MFWECTRILKRKQLSVTASFVTEAVRYAMNVAVHCKKNVRNGLLAKVVNADTIDTLTVLLP